jgi:plasmid stability protein
MSLGADLVALAPKWRYRRRMPSVQIKNVPDDVHRALRSRAAAAGQSLQEYLLALLVEEARMEPLDVTLDRIGQRSGGSLTTEFAVKWIREDRESH